MSRTGQFKDSGHYGRKAVLWTVRAALLIPVLLIAGATWLGEQIEGLLSWLNVWAQPCLYVQRGETYEQYKERVNS